MTVRNFKTRESVLETMEEQIDGLLKTCFTTQSLDEYLIPFAGQSRKACEIILEIDEHVDQIDELLEALAESRAMAEILLTKPGSEISLLEHRLNSPKTFAFAKRRINNISKILESLEEKFADQIAKREADQKELNRRDLIKQEPVLECGDSQDQDGKEEPKTPDDLKEVPLTLIEGEGRAKTTRRQIGMSILRLIVPVGKEDDCQIEVQLIEGYLDSVKAIIDCHRNKTAYDSNIDYLTALGRKDNLEEGITNKFRSRNARGEFEKILEILNEMITIASRQNHQVA